MKKLLKKIFSKKAWGYAPYFLLVLTVVLPWFFHSGYLFFTDFVVGPNLQINWLTSSIISDLFLNFFGLFLPPDLAQKFLITTILLFLVFAGKRLGSVLLPKKPALVFLVSAFFIFNPFVYDRMGYGQFGLVLAMGLMTFAVSYLVEYLEKKQNKQILLAGVFSGFSILFVVHFVFFNLIFYSLFLIITIIRRREYAWKKLIPSLLLVLLIVSAINFSLIVGFFLNYLGGKDFLNTEITRQDFIAFQTVGRDIWQAFSNVFLMGGFWGKDQYRYIDLTLMTQSWGRSFIILLPIMMWGVIATFRDKKRKNFAIGLVIIALVAIFLALGVRTGIGEKVTFFLFDRLPFYKGMRETQKWVSVLVICYGMFLAWGLDALFSTKLVKKHSFLFVVILLVTIAMQAPLMFWGMRGQFQPTNYPADWQDINKFIKLESYKAKSKECDEKILFLPWHTYMSFGFTGRIVANPARNFFQCPVISGTNMEWGGIYDNSGKKEGELVSKWLDAKGDTDLLKKNELNIGYVILAKDVDWANYSWLKERKEQMMAIRETDHLILYGAINE